jgi:hypothetical protein
MLPPHETAEHLYALVLVGLAAGVPGYALATLLPRTWQRPAWVVWPLLGIAFWSVALYALPFRGGLLTAAALAASGATCAHIRTRHASGGHAWARRSADDGPALACGVPMLTGRPVEPIQNQESKIQNRPPTRRAALLLALGGLPYLTPVFTKHVPDGMDGSRYVLSARVIAAHGGLPQSLAPVTPAVPFGATNHGLPTLAALAVLAGASPPAAVLATIPLTFLSLIGSLFMLIRPLARPTPTAVIAVATAWLAHQAQQTLGWGGFPGIAALALGVFAARLLTEVLRGRAPRAIVPLGLCVGAVSVIHGAVGAAWVYTLLPAAVVTGLVLSRRRRRGLLHASLAALVALGIGAAYYIVGRPHLAPGAAAQFRADAVENIFPQTGPAVCTAVGQYLRKSLSTTLTILAAGGVFLLVFARRWRTLALVLALVASVFLVLLNARYLVLPGSVLLFPERVRDFALVPAALALALAWREIARRVVVPCTPRPLIALALLVVAGTHHYRYFQKTAFAGEITADEWAGLQWAAVNLNPTTDFVATMYGTSGAYLPGVAGIPVTRWHAHPADQLPEALRMATTRPITHVWWVEREAVLSPIGRRDYDAEAVALQALLARGGAEPVFVSGGLRVLRLTAAAAQDAQRSPALRGSDFARLRSRL